MDSLLVERLRCGDRAAFREVYARLAQPTFRFLLRLAGRRDVAEDLHQETWMRVAQHHRRLRPDSDLAAWIFAIARNTFTSSRRKAVREGPVRDPLGAEHAEAALAFDSDPACLDLERALAALPEAHREILLLIGVEGLDVARVATILDLRADAARQRLARARVALTQALESTPSTRQEAHVRGGAR